MGKALRVLEKIGRNSSARDYRHIHSRLNTVRAGIPTPLHNSVNVHLTVRLGISSNCLRIFWDSFWPQILALIKIYFTVSDALGENCTFTTNPINGHATLSIDSKHILGVNDEIAHGNVIAYFCQPNSVLIGLPHNLCLNGAFEYLTPRCEVRCSPTVISSLTFIANCRLDKHKVPCTDAARPGTRARINCQRWYHSQNQQVTTCNSDGQWDPIPHPCEQICGHEAPQGTPFMIGGVQTSITKVPWHAGIYKRETDKQNFEHICGGSIINTKVVISAMHCFWDAKVGKPHPESMFRIAVGKYYRDFNHPNETRSQHFGIEKIHHNDMYRDRDDFYAADIAIVVLKNPIEYKVHIAAVCLKVYSAIGHREVDTKSLGMVAGWGMSDLKGTYSEYLKSVEVDIVTGPDCRQHMHTLFHNFITPDKFCAGHRGRNVSVCPGDSGGGLVIAEKSDNKSTYYLRGIVSAGQLGGNLCDANSYTTYLNTAYFDDWIINLSEPYRVPITPNVASSASNKTECTLKKIPDHAFVRELRSGDLLRIDDKMQHEQTILYSCKNKKYQLNGNPTNLCYHGSWLNKAPHCEPIGENVMPASPPKASGKICANNLAAQAPLSPRS